MSRPTRIILWSGIGLFAILAIGVAVLLTFDWNRAKPWISSRVSAATGRSFSINGDLSLDWHAPAFAEHSWLPWPRLHARNVQFGNPDWAKASPNMAEIGQVSFSVNPIALLGKRIVIPLLALESPQLTLERGKDGAANWQLPSREDTGWQFEVKQLALSKGTVRLVDAIRQADIRADIDTLAQPDDNYRLGWRAVGTLSGQPVRGEGRAGAALALRDKDKPYPVEAHLRIGDTAIEASGSLSRPTSVDLRLKISGASMAQLYPITGIVLPETRPFSTEGRLTGDNGGRWTYENFRGKVGATDLAGTLHYRTRQPRPLVEGTVSSEFLDFHDLSPLIGSDSPESKAKRGVRNAQPANKIFPVEEFKAERWTSIDTDVQFTSRKVRHDGQLLISDLVTRISLNGGVLTLAPLKFGMAGGNLVSNLRLDARGKPIKAEMKLTARHLKLKQLFPSLGRMQASFGEINGDASLSAAGNSISALLGASRGELTAIINEGAISKLFLEELGLNLGGLIVTQLFGDEQVKLNCAVADFAIEKGVMRTRTFLIDTEDAVINIGGEINLGKEWLALTVRPESKGLRLISLRSPLHVNGPFRNPQVQVDKGSLTLKAGSALALSAVAPFAAALLPLVNVGPGENSECASLLAK